MLRESGGSVSGEYLAERLNISRVAVWKILNRLRESGYEIKSARSGYSLLKTTERPVPWELDTYDSVEYFDELDSTMRRAEKLIESGCADGTTVVAGQQNHGIGADGGRWNSPDGGLYFTRIRRVPFPARYCGFLPAVIAVAVVEHLQLVYAIKAEYCWPCRIMAEGMVAGGVLTDIRVKNGTAELSSIGVGLNVGCYDEPLPSSAATLEGISGVHIPLNELLNGLLFRIKTKEEIFFRLGSQPHCQAPAGISEADKIRTACLEIGGLKGKKVSVQYGSEESISGSIVDIDFSGSLKIRSDKGIESYIHPGDPITYE